MFSGGRGIVGYENEERYVCVHESLLMHECLCVLIFCVNVCVCVFVCAHILVKLYKQHVDPFSQDGLI